VNSFKRYALIGLSFDTRSFHTGSRSILIGSSVRAQDSDQDSPPSPSCMTSFSARARSPESSAEARTDSSVLTNGVAVESWREERWYHI
jgi:capsid protein